MKKRLLLLPLMAAFVLSGCSLDLGFIKIGDTPTQDNGQNQQDDGNHSYDDNDDGGNEDTPPTPVTPSVESVTITGSAQELSLYGTMKLTATVVVKNGASQAVTWSSSDETVATVKDGLVTPKKVGTVTIRAVSKADSTKSDSVSITVVDKGFDPSFIQEGCEYVKEFPTAKVREFLGEGEYEIEELENLVGGAYVKSYAGDEESAACLQIIVDGVRDEEYAHLLDEAGFTKLYVNSNDEFEGVDPTGKYTVCAYTYFDSEEYDYVAPTYIEFYRSSEVWGSSVLTTDTAWDNEKIEKASFEDYGDEITSILPSIPFVAMGEEYSIRMVEDYSEVEYAMMLLEYYGLIDETSTDEDIAYWLEYLEVSGPSIYLSIYDYSLAEVFEGYETVLEGAGFALIEDEEYGDYYELSNGLEAIQVSYGFGEYGNEIIVTTGVATLTEFPTEIANEFIKNVIGSGNVIPAYEETEGASFQAQIFEDEMDIVMDEGTIEEFEAYKAKLELAGFEVEYIEASEVDYPTIFATKGKLVLEMELVQVEGDEDYLDYGPVYFYIYGDETKHEEKGIYLPEETLSNLMEGSFALELEVVDLDEAHFTWTSSDPTVADVSSEGVVTLNGVGETDITVTSDVSIPEVGGFYTATTHLVVEAKPSFEPVLEDLNAVLAEFEATEVITKEIIPEIECVSYSYFEAFDFYGCYVISGLNATETEESYSAKVEALGFEVSEDEYGPFYETEEFQICFNFFEADEEDPAVFQICIYFKEVAVEGEGATFDFSEMSGTEGEMNGISFTTSKAKGQSDPAYNDSKMELRLYANNTITFECESGLTDIFFDANTCGESKATGSFVSASTGTVSEVDGGFLWEGDATSVTLTVSGSGQIHINAIEVNGGGEGGQGGGISSGFEAMLDEIESIYDITLLYDSSDDSYYSEEPVCSSSSKTLLEVVTEAANKVPEEFSVEYDAPYLDYWDEEETEAGAFACYVTEDWSTVIQFGAWIENGSIYLQIMVYEI